MSGRKYRRRRRSSGQDHFGGRGRHKKATSPEALRWESEHLIPERPPWLPRETYEALAALRAEL